VGVFATITLIHNFFSILAQSQLPKQVEKHWKIVKINEKQWKQWKKQLWTLICILIIQTMNSPFSFIFRSTPIDFPSKMFHVNAISNWLELVYNPNLKALDPINGFWPIRLLHFVGPSLLDPHLKCSLELSTHVSPHNFNH
jgi:hypothetical protein